MSELAIKRDLLLQSLHDMGTVAVALSGGVDSAVVAKAAQLAIGARAVAVTGVSASLADGELDQACEITKQIGIRHEVIATQEFANPNYLQNSPDRCYHCKTELYSQLECLVQTLGVAVVVNGANLDDLGDYRPGMAAASEHSVRSPLAECGFTKADVRALALEWNLPIWDKPASPCLSSRVAYGEEVTPERLQMIDAAEQFLRANGLSTVRVRYHKGDLARLEIPVDAMNLLCLPLLRQTLIAHFKSLGFKFVTLDLEGFRSGSLNVLLPAVKISAGSIQLQLASQDQAE